MHSEIDYSLINLDKRAPESLSLQLEYALRKQFRNLIPGVSVKLLSERRLSTLLQLDRATVHRAYCALLESQLIERRKRSFFSTPDLRKRLDSPFPNIGIVIPAQFSYFINLNQQIPLLYLNGIFDRTAELNFSTTMLQLPPPEVSPEQMKEYLQSVIGRLFGIIHFGRRLVMNDLPLQLVLENDSVPQIFVSAFSRHQHIGSVIGDAATGGRELCEQLLSYGHTRIGMLSHFPEARHEFIAQDFFYEVGIRWEIMAQLFREYGLFIQPDWCLFNCTDLQKVKAQLRDLLRQPEHPTVLWCLNDATARLTIDSLLQLNLRVPNDIAVVGFDGASLQEMNDPLTTIKLPYYDIGRNAVDLLITLHDTGISAANRIAKVPTSLIMRRTLNNIAHDNHRTFS